MLRDEITKHLAMYDRAVDLYAAARSARDDIEAMKKSYVRSEPRRLIDALMGKRAVAVDDIAIESPAIDQAEQLADRRVDIARRAMRTAWPTAVRRPFIVAVDQVLPWIAEARLSTPWTSPMPAHLAYAWTQAGSLYVWRLPMVTPAHRFGALALDRPTVAMQRTWQAIRDGNIELVSSELPRRYRVTAYWPDLNADTE